jgi:2-hydroxychromene-2-carboxylate isomerase
MNRDDVRGRLEVVRRRREEGARLDADLARQQAALEATLVEADGDAAPAPADRRDAANARLKRAYGPVRSAEDLPGAIHAWRLNIPSVSHLSTQVRGERDHLCGDPAAPLIVVEYGDYQCTECADAHALYPRVRQWLEDGRLCVVFRHFPVVDAHPLALRAAQAAEAAAVQGRFWKMHDLLMQHALVGEQRKRHGRVKAHHPTIDLVHTARRAGLDIERFRADTHDPAILERVLEDFRGGLASGVNGTPTFYIDGRRADAGAVEEVYARIADSLATE